MDQSNTPKVPKRARHDGWTPARQRAFLIALGVGGCVTDACRAVGISTTSAYRAKARMPAFAAAWDKSLARMSPVLEFAAYQRGVEGWDEPVFQGGKLVGHRKRYSDNLLRLLIHRADPIAIGAQPAPGSPAAIAAAKEAALLAGGWFGTKATREETNAALNRALGAIARSEGFGESDGDG